MTPITFLYIFAVLQLIGLVIGAYRQSRGESGSGMAGLILGAILFGGLIWTILSVQSLAACTQ
jgi:hypothetical protein